MKKRMDRKKFERFSKRETGLLCFLLLLLAILIACIVQYKWKVTDIIFQNSFTFITSVVCSVLATTLLPRIFQSPNSDEIQKIVQEEIRNLPTETRTLDTEQIREMFKEEVIGITNKNSLVTPSAVYMDTDDPNPEFNEKLNQSILKSQNYIYFSDRAKYTAKRLYQGIDSKYTNPNLKIKVFVADIRDEYNKDNEVFVARADAYTSRERKLPPEMTRREIKEIIRQEKMDILNSIYCLAQLQDKFDIKIYLHKEIPFIRFEITDTMFVMTFLNRIATGKKHPLTVVYENESVFKPNYEEYAKEIMNRSYELTKDDLTLNGLIKLGEKANLYCDENSIMEYYNSLTNNLKNGGNKSGI